MALLFYLWPMLSRLAATLFFVLSCSTVFAFDNSGFLETGGGIEIFERHFPLRFLCNYNFASLWTSEFHEGALVSNRPVDVGIGFGYKDFYWDFLYPLPFTVGKGQSESMALETGIDFFPDDWWIKGKYRRYSGFTSGSSDSTIFVDLWQRDMYLSALWMGTAKGRFTPMAAYFLDRRQKYSAGSLLLGGRIQDSKAKGRDSTLAFYTQEREIYSTWVNMGYSYTWVFTNYMFLNLWGIAGLAVSTESESNDFIMLPDVDMKMAYGYIGDTWSWNTVMEMEYLPTIFNDHWEQKLVCAYKILIVRRF
ncbi:MAG: DUF4421 domain-containing protein [Fibrobacter sp.]|nr:DUF4421 domain-containing protein [Fibrobacter sp.]